MSDERKKILIIILGFSIILLFSGQLIMAQEYVEVDQEAAPPKITWHDLFGSGIGADATKAEEKPVDKAGLAAKTKSISERHSETVKSSETVTAAHEFSASSQGKSVLSESAVSLSSQQGRSVDKSNQPIEPVSVISQAPRSTPSQISPSKSKKTISDDKIISEQPSEDKEQDRLREAV